MRRTPLCAERLGEEIARKGIELATPSRVHANGSVNEPIAGPVFLVRDRRSIRIRRGISLTRAAIATPRNGNTPVRLLFS